MITLKHKETGRFIGTIDEQQLKFLMDQLEEESLKDQDYYINQVTLDMFEENGIDAGLFKMLKAALGSDEDMEIVWTRE
ncbi:galactosyldiacylglycerol synthase [bacterium]|nr:galactosyldiacylglycerol synthase [bacterium]